MEQMTLSETARINSFFSLFPQKRKLAARQLNQTQKRDHRQVFSWHANATNVLLGDCYMFVMPKNRSRVENHDALTSKPELYSDVLELSYPFSIKSSLKLNSSQSFSVHGFLLRHLFLRQLTFQQTPFLIRSADYIIAILLGDMNSTLNFLSFLFGVLCITNEIITARRFEQSVMTSKNRRTYLN